MNYQFATWQA